MAAIPREAWHRLGELLVGRRVEINRDYRNRRAFAVDVDVDYRVLYDIESARRTNYSQPTLRVIEHAYRLAPGSIDRTLAGGPLEPLAPETTANSPPGTSETPVQEPRTKQNVSRTQAEQIAGALEQLLATVMSRIGVLETEVAELRRENAELRADLSAIRAQLRHKSAKSA